MGKNKRILDSVHGYITIEEDICDNIIDTPAFQRLRRIEQMSIRSLFPCARHDRFTHSLGVYHLGTKIVESIKNFAKTNEIKYPNNADIVFESYRIACLLHDVGHSPFSHTFEDYFDNDDYDLVKMIKGAVDSVSFTNDFQSENDAAPHEIMSAYVTYYQYKDFIKTKGLDIELIVRMIVGCKYSNVVEKSFENAFIDLIHGDIIDADGLDYVIRDSWASGYNAAQVDTERLINAIYIAKNNKKREWCVCYSHKALNEIESVLSIKTYQQFNAITHHTVVLEQYLLIESMKSAAQYAKSKTVNDKEEERTKALEDYCKVKEITNLTDDTFVTLMKNVEEDKFIKQWLSRKYDMAPLWKSEAELLHRFPILRNNVYSPDCWLFSEDCKQFICQNCEFEQDEVLIRAATGSNKRLKIKKVNFYIDGDIVPYTDIHPNETIYKAPRPFAYIFIKKMYNKEGKEDEKAFCDKKDEILKKLNIEISKYLFDNNPTKQHSINVSVNCNISHIQHIVKR